MSAPFKWQFFSRGIPGASTIRFSDPKTPADAHNARQQDRFWWLPWFVRRCLWPVTYELLTFGELAEKRRRQVETEMFKGMWEDGKPKC